MSSSATSRPTAAPTRRRSSVTSRSCLAATVDLPRHDVRGARCRRRARPAARCRPRRRAGPHQRAGQPQHEAVGRRRGAARRRHRRHHDGQHPAPRVAERRDREDHRRAAARDRARRGRAPRRADRAGRHEPRGAAPPDGTRQHLPARAGRRGARQLLPARQPLRPARARPPLGRRPRRGEPAGLHGRPRHRRHVGDARAGRRGRDRSAGREPARAPCGSHRRTDARRARSASTSSSPTACATTPARQLMRQHRLVEALGGSYREIVGDGCRRRSSTSPAARRPPRSSSAPAAGDGGTRSCTARSSTRSCGRRTASTCT